MVCDWCFHDRHALSIPFPLSLSVYSSRAESKCSQRQQKALSSMVDRLSENLKQLQKENISLREELNTDSPAGGFKGHFSLRNMTCHSSCFQTFRHLHSLNSLFLSPTSSLHRLK